MSNDQSTKPDPTEPPPEHAGSWLESDGSVCIHKLRMPPSELWSEEYKAYQAKLANQGPATDSLPVPGRAASRAEWDHFDASWDRRHHADLLRIALDRYAVDVCESTIAGIRVAVVTPRRGVAPDNQSRVLINLHGGGFVYSRGLALGQLESIPVAAMGALKVVTLDYRQAPFHSYPSASEDVEAVYRQLLTSYEPSKIGIYGCSAGGTLTAQAVARFGALGLPQPGAVGMFSIAPMPPGDRPPWGRSWGESGMWFAGVPKHDLSAADRALWEPVRWYMESAAETDELAYPGLSDAVLTRFPPTLFLSGTRDFALSSVAFTHARLLRLGVDSSLYIMEGGGHAAHVYALGTPEAHHAQSHVASWFRKQLQ